MLRRGAVGSPLAAEHSTEERRQANPHPSPVDRGIGIRMPVHALWLETHAAWARESSASRKSSEKKASALARSFDRFSRRARPSGNSCRKTSSTSRMPTVIKLHSATPDARCEARPASPFSRTRSIEYGSTSTTGPLEVGIPAAGMRSGSSDKVAPSQHRPSDHPFQISQGGHLSANAIQHLPQAILSSPETCHGSPSRKQSASSSCPDSS